MRIRVKLENDWRTLWRRWRRWRERWMTNSDRYKVVWILLFELFRLTVCFIMTVVGAIEVSSINAPAVLVCAGLLCMYLLCCQIWRTGLLDWPKVKKTKQQWFLDSWTWWIHFERKSTNELKDTPSVLHKFNWVLHTEILYLLNTECSIL